MTQRRSTLRSALPFAVLLFLALLAAMAVVYLRLRGEVSGDRPVVLIHSPVSSQEIPVGRGVMVHATALLDRGLARLELWADGELAGQVEADEGETQTGLVLAMGWEPPAVGYHRLTLRAVGLRGEEGESTIAVVAVEPGPAVGAHSVAPGETVASIAADYGASPDDLSDLNPGLTSAGLTAGDSILVPLDFLPPEEPAPAPVADVEGERPGAGGAEGAAAPEVRVRLEALGLQVDSAYEGVHCYVSVGEYPPVWIPDSDHDAATDESFEPLDGAAWDIAGHYSGDAAPSIPWPSDQPLPFEMSCVGVRGGGSDAVELGRVALSIPPSEWDGVSREVESETAEGSFTLAYRVGPGEIYTLDLDPGMHPPFNLRLDDRRQSLRWEYEPAEPAEGTPSIDGFLIFLNDALMWSVDGDVRESRLPDQWFTPPCDEEYVFTVRAFVSPYPEGPYSNPSNEVTIAGEEAGPEGCTRDFVVRFVTLETRDLGGDRDDDPGDRGPIYGGVYVNDAGQEFDGRCPDPGPGEAIVCSEIGLDHNARFDMARLPWEASGESGSLFVEARQDESLMLRFSFLDADSGRNSEDSLICEGGTEVSWMELERGGVIEETIGSDERGDDGAARCAVAYTVDQVGGPVGAARGGPPLPWLDIVDRTIDEAGRIQVHIQNTGTAAWANHDLRIELSRRGGSVARAQTWPEVYLDPGAEPTVFTFSDPVEGPAANLCVELDPDDEVVELYEATGALYHGTICPRLPDLILEDIQFDEDSDRLLWTVRNEGEGAAEDIELDVRVDYGNRGPVLLPSAPRLLYSLDPWESTAMSWPGDTLDREGMLSGFTLTVDPNNEVVEEVDDNNSAEVPAGARLRFEWRGGRLHWYPVHSYEDCGDYDIAGLAREQDITMQVFVESPYASRRVASWSISREFGARQYEYLLFDETNYDNETYVAEFEIAGWEWLRVWATGEWHNDSLGSGSATHGPEEMWGSGHRITDDGSCQFEDRHYWIVYPSENNWGSCGAWNLQYSVCDVAP
jgi:hypothetical protein